MPLIADSDTLLPWPILNSHPIRHLQLTNVEKPTSTHTHPPLHLLSTIAELQDPLPSQVHVPVPPPIHSTNPSSPSSSYSIQDSPPTSLPRPRSPSALCIPLLSFSSPPPPRLSPSSAHNPPSTRSPPPPPKHPPSFHTITTPCPYSPPTTQYPQPSPPRPATHATYSEMVVYRRGAISSQGLSGLASVMLRGQRMRACGIMSGYVEGRWKVFSRTWGRGFIRTQGECSSSVGGLLRGRRRWGWDGRCSWFRYVQRERRRSPTEKDPA